MNVRDFAHPGLRLQRELIVFAAIGIAGYYAARSIGYFSFNGDSGGNPRVRAMACIAGMDEGPGCVNLQRSVASVRDSVSLDRGGGNANGVSPPDIDWQGNPWAPVDRFHLVGVIDPAVVPYFMDWISNASKPEIVIDSPGGSQEASEAIADAIAKRGGVICRVGKLAASGAFGILQSCATRALSRTSRLITHEPYLGYSGALTIDLAKQAMAELYMDAALWGGRCRARMKISQTDYDERVRGHDWQMDPQEAILVGAADLIQ